MAKLEYDQEQNNLLKLLTDQLPSSDQFNHAYLGGTDIGSKDSWYWISTGGPVKYQLNWYSDQKNNTSDRCMKVFIINQAFKLSKTPCDAVDASHPFICEKSNQDKWYIA